MGRGLRWGGAFLLLRGMKIFPLIVVVMGALLLPALPAQPIETTAGAPRAEGWRSVDVTAELDRPWAVAWLPDGAMLITEKSGSLRVVRDGELAAAPVAGVPAVYSGGQGGLMDVALHPKFSENRFVYFTLATGAKAENRTELARGVLNGDATAVTEVRTIFQVSQAKDGSQHFGSRILWLPDGTLLLAIGDGGNPPAKLDGELIRKQAQNLRSHLGKVLRLRDDGTPAPDNPMAGRADADPALWSFGHRNIQGLARDPVTGAIWATEHGARGGDELNRLAPGANHGWPVVTYSREYSFFSITDERSRPGMVDPLVVWTPAIAPSGLVVYSGDKFPGWRGDLFAGGLISKEVRRIDLDAEGRVVGQQSLAIGQRVRDVRQGPDGFLYVLTDEPAGRLLRIEPTAN